MTCILLQVSLLRFAMWSHLLKIPSKVFSFNFYKFYHLSFKLWNNFSQFVLQKESGFACKCKEGFKVQNFTNCVRIEHPPKILPIPPVPSVQTVSSETSPYLDHPESLSRSVLDDGARGHDRSPDGQPIKERQLWFVTKSFTQSY